MSVELVSPDDVDPVEDEEPNVGSKPVDEEPSESPWVVSAPDEVDVSPPVDTSEVGIDTVGSTEPVLPITGTHISAISRGDSEPYFFPLSQSAAGKLQ